MPRSTARRLASMVAGVVGLSAVACAPARADIPAAGAPEERTELESLAGRGRTEVPAEGAAYDSLSILELAILAELNAARTNPSAYARRLESLLPHFDERHVLRVPGSGVAVVTREGAAAVREAIRVLRDASRAPALAPVLGLQAAARDHVRDQGRTGRTGHTGADGGDVARRVARYGEWRVSLAENIAYGPPTAREVIVSFIVDDGVADRGHRTVLLDPTSRTVGISCGPHPRFGIMCVLVQAGGFRERTSANRSHPGAGEGSRGAAAAAP